MNTELEGAVPLQPSEAVHLPFVRLRQAEARGIKQQA